jgi:hypothetical protein
MTPPNPTVAPGIKLCKKGLHQYPQGLTRCPNCLKKYKQAHHLKNKDRYNAATHARYERVKGSPEEKEKERKRRLSAYHREYFKARYYSDIEASRQEGREWRENNKERPVWAAMIRRCCDSTSDQYKDYGARGITVCPQWRGNGGYKQFISDMGRRPVGKYTLERKDNEEGYFPENCEWATQSRQNRNKRNNFRVEYNGKTQCLADWAEELQMPYYSIYMRIKRLGWPVGKAFTEPIREAVFQTHDELCDRAEAWLRSQLVGCRVVARDIQNCGDERADAIGWKGTNSVLVECKVTRDDFRREMDKKIRISPGIGMGRLRYYMVPENLIKVEELPERWGLLYVKSRAVVIIRDAEPMESWNKDAELASLVNYIARGNA